MYSYSLQCAPQVCKVLVMRRNDQYEELAIVRARLAPTRVASRPSLPMPRFHLRVAACRLATE